MNDLNSEHSVSLGSESSEIEAFRFSYKQLYKMIISCQDPNRIYEIIEKKCMCLVAPHPKLDKSEAEKKFE